MQDYEAKYGHESDSALEKRNSHFAQISARAHTFSLDRKEAMADRIIHKDTERLFHGKKR